MPFEITKLAEQPQAGGHFEVTKPSTGQPTPEPDVLRESEAFEDWLPYIGRNAAQLVTSTPYSLARSYGGLGNLMKGALEDLPLPEPVKNFLLAQQKQQMPSYGQAHEEAAQYLPKFAGEMRPGDELIQSLIPQAGLAYATGGLSSLPALAETLGMLGGSQVGGNIAQGLFPESKLAPELGSLAGGFGGAKFGRTVGAMPTPTRVLHEPIKNIETAAAQYNENLAKEQLQSRRQGFETQKTADLTNLEDKYLQNKAQRTKQLDEELSQRQIKYDTEMQELEGKKSAQLEELHKTYPAKVQQLMEEEKRLKQAIPQEYDEFNKWKKNRIENIEERKGAYDEEIRTLNKIMKENAEKHESLANNEISKSGGKSLARVINDARINLELLDDRDKTRFLNFLDSVEGKIQTTGLTLNDAKDWYKKANSMIFSESTATEMQGALHDVMAPKGGLRDYIKETGSPEHTKAWTTYNDAYSRQKNLEKTRKDFRAEQDAEKAAIRAERMEEFGKYSAKEKATEAIAERKALEKEYKSSLAELTKKEESNRKDLAKEYNESLKKIAKEAEEKGNLAEKEHNDAVKVIGNKTFEDILRSEQAQQALESKFIEALKALPEKINKPGRLDEMAGKWGAAAMGTALGYMFGGNTGSILGGLAGKLLQYGAKETKYAKEVFKVHPQLKREYYKLFKDATRIDVPKLTARLLTLGAQTKQYADENEV